MSYTDAREHLRKQEALLKSIDRFFAEQERRTSKRWTDDTFSVKVRSSGFMAALRSGGFVKETTMERAEKLISTERAKWKENA